MKKETPKSKKDMEFKDAHWSKEYSNKVPQKGSAGAFNPQLPEDRPTMHQKVNKMDY